MSENLVPVAYCPTCKDAGPVFILQEEEHTNITVVICLGCETFLNAEKEVHLDWYEEELLEEATGWKYIAP